MCSATTRSSESSTRCSLATARARAHTHLPALAAARARRSAAKHEHASAAPQDLRGVSAGETAIATVGAEGHSLRYRGYDVVELAAASTFEEVAYLLLRGELPKAAELDAYRQRLAGLRELPAVLRDVLERHSGRRASDGRLRTGCSMLGTLESEARLLAPARRRGSPDRGVPRDASLLAPLLARVQSRIADELQRARCRRRISCACCTASHRASFTSVRWTRR